MGTISGADRGPSRVAASHEDSRMTIEVSVDPDLCIGSGDCVRLLPDAFRIDEAAGVSVPLAGAGDADPRLLLRAAVGCPTQSIRLVGPDGIALRDSD
jgi:ferredoxin